MENYKLSDSKLVLLYKHGNEGAIGVLLERHKSRIYTTIHLIVKDRFIAEEPTPSLMGTDGLALAGAEIARRSHEYIDQVESWNLQLVD